MDKEIRHGRQGERDKWIIIKEIKKNGVDSNLSGRNVLEREVRNLNRNRVIGKITFLGRLDKLLS